MPRKHAFRPTDAPSHRGTGYPPPFDQIAPTRVKHRLGDHVGLDQFGVNYTILPPGEQSALRHYHRLEDEFTMVLEGEVVLVTDEGEEILTAGMCAAFKAGVANGHHLINRSDKPAVYLEIGTRTGADETWYPDDDLHVVTKDGVDHWTRKDGSSISETPA